jgi:hypothetical protein
MAKKKPVLTALDKKIKGYVQKILTTDEGLLDELVIDLKNREASQAVNDGKGDFDTLHNVADQSASSLNNEGVEAQIRYLISSLGEGGAFKQIEEALNG